MLIIRNSQINRLNNSLIENFKNDCLIYFYNSNYSISGLALDDAKILIEKMINRAISFNILKFTNIFQFIELYFLYEKNFNNLNTQINTILTYPDRDEDVKVQLLRDFLKFEEIIIETKIEEKTNDAIDNNLSIV